MTKDERRIAHWYREMEKEGPRERYLQFVEDEARKYEEAHHDGA